MAAGRQRWRLVGRLGLGLASVAACGLDQPPPSGSDSVPAVSGEGEVGAGSTGNTDADGEAGSDTGVEGCDAPWGDPVANLGRGEALDVEFTDVSVLLGDPFQYSGAWPMGCPSEDPGSAPAHPCPQKLQAGAAAAGDLDGDGDLDLVMPVLEGPDLWFRNTLDEGMVGFELWDAVVSPGPSAFDTWASSGVGLLDFDGDGDLDVHMSAIGQASRLLRNEGGSPPTFAWVEDLSSLESFGAAGSGGGYGIGVGDFDRDGDLDMFTTHWLRDSTLDNAEVQARLLVNEGGAFVDAPSELNASALDNNPGGIWVFAPTFVDLDDDDWPDLALVADNHTSKLLFNEGGTRFSDETFGAGVNLEHNGMGSTFADFNGDGHLDWYVSAIYNIGGETCLGGVCESGNRLYMNRGPRCFEERAFATGVHAGAWGWGVAGIDLDNDGDQDLVETNGFRSPYAYPGSTFENRPMRVWMNRGVQADGANAGDPIFEDVGGATGLAQERGQGRGLLSFDYDGDGDLDLLIVQNSGPARLLRNDGGEANCSLRVSLEGSGGNRQGVNAKLRLRRDSDDGWQVREMGVRQSFSAQSPNVAHFGLGPADALTQIDGAPVVETLEIRVGGQETIVLSNVPACGEITVPLPN